MGNIFFGQVTWSFVGPGSIGGVLDCFGVPSRENVLAWGANQTSKKKPLGEKSRKTVEWVEII